MKKSILIFFAGIVFAAAVGAFFYFRARPGPAKSEPVKTVVENPTKEQKQSADVIISKESKGELSGSTHHTSLSQPGDAYQIPVAGSISTTYRDAGTGQTIGQGEHQVTGTTTVTLQDDGGIKADTEFADSVEVAIMTPKKEQRWSVGIAAGIDTHGDFDRTIYGQYDALKLSVIVVPIRGEWTAGDGFRVMAGIELRF